MNPTTPSAARTSKKSKPRTDSEPQRDLRPEREEAIHLQEQVAGPQPARRDRRPAEILAERLAESGSVSHVTPVFIP